MMVLSLVVRIVVRMVASWNDFKLIYGFCFMADRDTDRRMDIDGDSGVAFTTESLEKGQ